MVGGFNHNFSYKGQIYHVQTEDSGVPRARITTLLYRAGSVIARETSDYTDICTEAELSSRVEQMMKEQHRAMLKNLKDGVFDAKIAQFDPSSDIAADIEQVPEFEAQKSGAATPEAVAEVSRPSAPVSEPDWRAGRLEGKVKDYLDAGR